LAKEVERLWESRADALSSAASAPGDDPAAPSGTLHELLEGTGRTVGEALGGVQGGVQGVVSGAGATVGSTLDTVTGALGLGK
jgi:hypothetical protein